MNSDSESWLQRSDSSESKSSTGNPRLAALKARYKGGSNGGQGPLSLPGDYGYELRQIQTGLLALQYWRGRRPLVETIFHGGVGCRLPSANNCDSFYICFVEQKACTDDAHRICWMTQYSTKPMVS